MRQQPRHAATDGGDGVSSERQRLVVGTALLVGWGVALWFVHHWAVHAGHLALVRGVRPAYVLIASVPYWGVTCGLWRLFFPKDERPLPWAPPREPWPRMDERAAQELATRIRAESGLDATAVDRVERWVVEIDTPATRYRLVTPLDWDDGLRRRYVRSP